MISLDQFRGYTVAGMFLVNFLGGFAIIHGVLKHNDTYCSYADTIMPQFFFAAGFAYRLTFVKGLEKKTRRAVYTHAVKRNLTLLLIGQMIYGFSLSGIFPDGVSSFTIPNFMAYLVRPDAFQALTHIGLTCFWILPVIGAAPWVRVIFMVASGALHLGLSQAYYHDWVWSHSAIDGGPLGFLTWTIPTLAGSFAYDIITTRTPKAALRRLFGWAFILMILGYGISCLNAITGDPLREGWQRWFVEPPFFAPTHPTDLWTMSQKAGSLSYMTFTAGFSMLIYALLVVLCDRWRWQWPVFRTLGQNALVGYLLSYLVEATIESWAPGNAALPHVLVLFLLYFLITYGIMRVLEWRKLYLRL